MSSTPSVGAESIVRLLQTGHEHFAPPLASHEVWFALEQQAGQWILRPVRPTAVAETPICGLEGTHISVEGIGDGFFLIGGVPNFREGLVTATVSSRRVLYPGQTVSVLYAYLLEAHGTATGTTGGMLFLDYAFWLRHQDRRQLVATRPRMSDENPPSVVWAGDLDRDGVPDLILNMPEGDVGGHYILFLSSMADGDQMVSPVASYSIPGC